MTGPDHIPAYAGYDMIRFMCRYGFHLPGDHTILSMTNVRDTAIIVTHNMVLRAKPCDGIGFTIEVAAYL